MDNEISKKAILLLDNWNGKQSGDIIETFYGIANTLIKRGKAVEFNGTIENPIFESEIAQLKYKNMQLIVALKALQEEFKIFKDMKDEYGQVKEPWFLLDYYKNDIEDKNKLIYSLKEEISMLKEQKEQTYKSNNTNTDTNKEETKSKRKYNKKVVRDLENKNIIA